MTEEFEQYRIAQAEAWLVRVRRLVSYRDALEESAAAQFALADGLKAVRYDKPLVRSTPSPDAIPNAVAHHEEMGGELKRIADEATARLKEAARALSQMGDPTEATCLHLYYVDALETWEHVCVRMHYTYDGMMKLRRRALLDAYDVMPHSERDPMPPAI